MIGRHFFGFVLNDLLNLLNGTKLFFFVVKKDMACGSCLMYFARFSIYERSFGRYGFTCFLNAFLRRILTIWPTFAYIRWWRFWCIESCSCSHLGYTCSCSLILLVICNVFFAKFNSCCFYYSLQLLLQ